MAENTLATGIWILRLTPTEFQNLQKSNDARLQQYLFSLSCTQTLDMSRPTMEIFLNYLVSMKIITADRIPALMAPRGSIPEQAFLP